METRDPSDCLRLNTLNGYHHSRYKIEINFESKHYYFCLEFRRNEEKFMKVRAEKLQYLIREWLVTMLLCLFGAVNEDELPNAHLNAHLISLFNPFSKKSPNCLKITIPVINSGNFVILKSFWFRPGNSEIRWRFSYISAYYWKYYNYQRKINNCSNVMLILFAYAFYMMKTSRKRKIPNRLWNA